MTDSSHPICRICLTAENRSLYNLSPYARLMQDFGGISVQDSDGLPQWLCSECIMLLKKSVRFREKMLRAHSVLYEYVTRCAPFPIDGTDVELLKYSSPQLSTTATLCCYFRKSRNGFHTVLQHEIPKGTKTEFESSVPYALPTSVEIAPFKNEPDFSDYEDNIPLDEYKHTIDKFTVATLSALLQDGDCEVKTEPEPAKDDESGNTARRKRKRRHRDKTDKEYKKKRKLNRPPKSPKRPEDLTEKPLRPPKDYVDPTKIKIITLDPEEQIAELRIESEKDDFCKLKFKCKLCYKGFNYEAKLENHMAKHSPSRGTYKCNLCHMYLPTPNSYNVHMYIHTRRYECLKCGRRMIDRQSIVDHYRHQHEGLATYYTCHYCGKISSNNKTHRGHLRNHHGGERPKCDLCGKTFVNKDSLTEHILIHQGIKNYECIKCNKTFRTKTQLKHHQLKHTDVREFYCVECDTRFKSAHSLKQHLIKSAKHRDVQTLQFECPTCNKRFESASLVSRHTRVQHLGERAWACGVCPARLASRAALGKHERRHQHTHVPPVRTHCCHTCGRMFSRASVLQSHARTHSGARPHACSLCARAFTQRAALVTHVKLVHLHLKRTDKVKPEIINAIPKFLDTDSARAQTLNDLENQTSLNTKHSKNIAKLPIEFKIENNINLANNMVESTNNMAQSTNNIVLPTNNTVLSTNNMAPSTNNMAQSTNNIAQSTNNMAQSTNNMAQSTNNMAQSTNNMAQSTNNMAQSTNNMAQSTNNMDQTKLPIQSKIVLHNEKLSPSEIKMGKGLCVDSKTRVFSKPTQLDCDQSCDQPKQEMFDEDWRNNDGHQVYYYIHQ